MKASELIQKLQALIAAHGDLPVQISEPGPSARYDEVVRLLKRGRVGEARVRLHKGKYWELDFAFPAGVRVKRFRKYFKSPRSALRIGPRASVIVAFGATAARVHRR